jgi:uncharacterized protein YyaL (SSP411 family)
VAAIALIRMHAFTSEAKYQQWAEKTLEAFAGIAPQYGMFAATYGLAATLFAHHPAQVVITGAADDAVAKALESAANSVFRFGKSVLRVLPDSVPALPPALLETLPHLPKGKALAIVCAGSTCFPPTSDPKQLQALILGKPSSAAAS